jgi:hypothetical protein
MPTFTESQAAELVLEPALPGALELDEHAVSASAPTAIAAPR